MQKDFKRYLKSRGLKLTKGREAIVGHVLSMRGHFDLEELYHSLRGSGLTVSRASVYRTLPLLIESGLIEEVERTEKHAHYERKTGGHHDHMLCISCGKVTEFYSEALERLQERLCRKEGFDGMTHTLEIKGRCRRCRRRDIRPRTPASKTP